MADILEEVSFVVLAVLPNINAVTRFSIQQVVASIGLAILFIILLPNSKPVANALLEVAFIVAAVAPYVLTVTLWKTINVLTVVTIAVGELLVSLTMLQSVLECSMADIT